MDKQRAIGIAVGGAIALTGGLLWARRAYAGPPPVELVGDIPTATGPAGMQLIRYLVDAAGDRPGWEAFWLASSSAETAGTFTSNVVLGNSALYPAAGKPSPVTDTRGPAEARAAADAYAYAAGQGRFDGCPWPKQAYIWGTCGWWSQMPPIAFAAYVGSPLICRHPHYLLHPVDQYVCARAHAVRLMRRDSFKARPQWKTLRAGWGSPARMGNEESIEDVAATFQKHTTAVGLPPEWLDAPVEPLTDQDPAELWALLMRRFS